jgi:hypothetical protein
MFAWIKRKAIFMRMTNELIEELGRTRTPQQVQDLRSALHRIQLLIIMRFDNAEGFLAAPRQSKKDFQIELEHIIYRDHGSGISDDYHLGLLAMHHFVAGIREHHGVSRLGGAIGQFGIAPGFFASSKRHADGAS